MGETEKQRRHISGDSELENSSKMSSSETQTRELRTNSDLKLPKDNRSFNFEELQEGNLQIRVCI